MKLFVVYFLATAFNSALSLPKDIAIFSGKPNPGNIGASTPLIQSTVTINGNVTVQINDNRKSCCDQKNSETVPCPNLPEGYVITSESDEYITAIKFHSTTRTWNEARKTCSREGGFLAYATSKQEERLYMKIMDEKKVDNLWVGIHDLFAERDFATVDGKIAKEVAYNTWLPGEPNNNLGTEGCVHYRRSAKQKGLNDISCNASFAFNCKLIKKK